jgi:hypothetical protein
MSKEDVYGGLPWEQPRASRVRKVTPGDEQMPILPRIAVLTDRVVDILAKDKGITVPCLQNLPKKKINKSCGCKHKTSQQVEVVDYSVVKDCLMKDVEQLNTIKAKLKVDQLVIFIVNNDGKAERVSV